MSEWTWHGDWKPGDRHGAGDGWMHRHSDGTNWVHLEGGCPEAQTPMPPMTATDVGGGIIDRLMERRYGAPYSAKWWRRFHDQSHQHGLVMLACPECPDAAELRRMIFEEGLVPLCSANDLAAAFEAPVAPIGERDL